MSINPKQTWTELCGDIQYICKIYPSLLTLPQFEEAIQEVLNCLNKKSRKSSLKTANTEVYGEKSQMNHSSVVNRGFHINVSVVEC